MIYFIGNSELIKIGFSDNIQQRIDSYESLLPFDFEIFGVIEGDEVKEQLLHVIFKEHHVNREWFKNCREILDYVNHEKIEIFIKRRLNRQKRFFGELKALRLKAGLTLRAMGMLMNVDPAQVDKIERRYQNGRGNISSVIKYLTALGYELKISEIEEEKTILKKVS